MRFALPVIAAGALNGATSASAQRHLRAGRGNFQKLGASGCTVLEKVGLCKGKDGEPEQCHDGSSKKREFACEDLETGAIYAIDNDVPALAQGGVGAMGGRNAFDFEDDDAKSHLLDSAMDDFVGEALIDVATGRISFIKGKFRKSKNPTGPRGRGGVKSKWITSRHLQQTGDRNVVVLNVKSSNGDVTGFTNWQLADSIFGEFVGGPDQVNLASQFSACSHNQLNFRPQPDSASANTAVSDLEDGVATVTSTVASSDGNVTDAMVNDATSKLSAAHGDRGGADNVMVCLPDAAMDGTAYAYINHWLSVYSHVWCTRPSAQLHEVGHNLGLSHAGENGNEYADASGFMGYASGLDEQRRCFTGPKTYKLRWFEDRHVELTAPLQSFDGRLYGFTQWANTTSADKMIIRLSDPSCTTCDWYISFNHQAGFNQDTSEGANQVQLHTKEGTVSQYVDTYVQTRLSAQSSYTLVINWKKVDIFVGEINTAEGWAQVRVAPTPVPTTCPADQVKVTVAVTTDDYPWETTWTVSDISGGQGQVVFSGGPYDAAYANTQFSSQSGCLDMTRFEFKILDSYGDGICCNYGKGGYEVFMDGVSQGTPGGEFGGNETLQFGDNGFIYALSNDYRNFCGYDVHWAPKCNGRLASITNSDELDLAKMLLARNPGVKVGGVSGSAWIGGMYDSQNSQWGWSDGTTWFDDDEKMWNASPVPTGPRILLKTDGTNYWYKPITSGYCGPSQKGAAIVILPADYDDPNAAFYQNHDFALCRDFIDTIIDTVAIV